MISDVFSSMAEVRRPKIVVYSRHCPWLANVTLADDDYDHKTSTIEMEKVSFDRCSPVRDLDFD